MILVIVEIKAEEALSKLLNEILMKFIGLWTIYESNTDNKEAHEIEKNILLYSIDFPQEIIKKFILDVLYAWVNHVYLN